MTAWVAADLPLEARILMALDEVRPALEADGGGVELVEVVGGEVRVRLLGACNGCPMAPSTLVDFVEERVKLFAPEVERVVSVTS